jgi:hypothetical protein
MRSLQVRSITTCPTRQIVDDVDPHHHRDIAICHDLLLGTIVPDPRLLVAVLIRPPLDEDSTVHLHVLALHVHHLLKKAIVLAIPLLPLPAAV